MWLCLLMFLVVIVIVLICFYSVYLLSNKNFAIVACEAIFVEDKLDIQSIAACLICSDLVTETIYRITRSIGVSDLSG